MRQKLLNTFCLKLFKFTHLMNSEEMKIFLSPSVTEVKKTLNTIESHPHEELLKKYHDSFDNYYEAYDSVIGRKKINDFQAFLKKSSSNLKV